ncbi:MAG: SDR family NAD(P)-dependent oxidoreductase [Lachnospiraceae bacterium]|nr:SDR family NAD(P)-dependent oxidoreductase [Lachnospiraceae bacterium]
MERKTAMITGASRGIGKAIARELAGKGYDLFLTCRRNEQMLSEVGRGLEREFGIHCRTDCFPIYMEERLAMLFEDIPYLDVLVNNAGISHIGLLADMSFDQWQEVINTNLSACFLTCKYAIPEMIRRKKGKIINISSVWGNVGASMEVAYSASKGGVNAFTRALARELAPCNIQVNAVACGVIDTDMNRCFDREDMDELISEIPADRMGNPDEVAALVGMLCSGNEYLTGQIIALDGGWM